MDNLIIRKATLNDFRCEEFDKIEVDWEDKGGISIYKFSNQVE